MNIGIVPPYNALPPHTRELRAEVREFIRQDQAEFGWQAHVDSWIASWDPAFSRRLGDQGWLGLTIPKKFGGHGRSHLDRYVVTEELLAAGAPVAAHWVADRQVGPALTKYGNRYQCERYLPAISRGECYFAIGMSEPESGSDLANVQTRGVQVDGGWEVSGTKVWTSGAHHAHAFFVLARTEPLDTTKRHRGLSQFVIELDAPGIEIRPIRLLTGQHHFNEVVLDRVFVGDDMVLGHPGQGWAQVTSELGFERSGPERLLSTTPLIDELANEMRRRPNAHDSTAELGALISRLSTLRQLSASIAGCLSVGEPADLAAAVVKDLGTQYEASVVEVAATTFDDASPDISSDKDFPRLLAEGILHTPGFTLRGGTSEILRGVVARGMGLR